VVLQRRLAGEPLRFKRMRLNLFELLQKGDQLQNPYLLDGDTISVARAAEPVAESIEVAATNLSPERITVYMVGEVKGAGAVQLPANTPLIQALLAAGGLDTWRANRSKVELVRLNRNGTLLREHFQFNLSQGASNDRNPPLRDGDTVIVNRSGLAVANDALTAIGGPLTNLASILTLFRLAGTN
jgi:polysaccharide export outer membrane protein